MSIEKFIGRKPEMKRLNSLLKKKAASFVIIKGRRRIGKSRLIAEFGEQFDQVISLRGIAPVEESTLETQLDEFTRQMAQTLHMPAAKYSDWGDALWALSDKVKSGRILLVFDEISWMGSKDPHFLSKIKDAWDTYFKNNNELIFIICGSASAWIEKNIMSNAGFVGRLTFSITLKELSLSECRQFWPKNVSDHEVLKTLCVTGGVPKYLEEINPSLSAEDNIKELCFTAGGLLVDEYRQIFSDIFLRDSNYYTKILSALENGSKDLSQLKKTLSLDSSGRLSEYLWELELAGFIDRDYTWKIKTGEDSKLSCYRLKDNYLRFYLKYIDKNMDKINRETISPSSLNWHSAMGLQFENLVLSNRQAIHKLLGIADEDIINANPYFQTANKNRKGCQIDYMIQTRFGSLFIVEIKFTEDKVNYGIIKEVQEKIERLDAPNRFSYRPVLIHVNGVTEQVKKSSYFAHTINMSDLLKQ